MGEEEGGWGGGWGGMGEEEEGVGEETVGRGVEGCGSKDLARGGRRKRVGRVEGVWERRSSPGTLHCLPPVCLVSEFDVGCCLVDGAMRYVIALKAVCVSLDLAATEVAGKG